MDPDIDLVPESDKYTVVARRYRPKTFEDLVGQDTVAQGLLRAIEMHRVGHAYLFTGARGVGKTSTARIFAKALNASDDGSGRFDPQGDVAQAIDRGDDMDVIEIDGASNRGIDEIRQLRANASIRPSRSRFKIYIIDEVHMLTTQAFNALLKTLEEPPTHVKFIFCTTDPEKIPITVLSRCQRFDFPPVASDQILARLKLICDNEGTEADEEALRIIARRAAGSMRDSQSLLEQLLSFGGQRITVDDVHALLGTADETRLAAFAQCLMERDAAGVLVELDRAISEGVDAGQLGEQLLGYLRDLMALSIGAPQEMLRTANPSSADMLRNLGHRWGTMTLLSAMQILDEILVRMKHSVQNRILLEVALVQICHLQDLQSLANAIQGLSSQSSVPQRPPVPAAPRNATAPQSQSAASQGVAPDPKKKELIADASQPSAEPPPRARVVPPPMSSLEPADRPIDTPASPAPPAPSASDSVDTMTLFRQALAGIEGVLQQAADMALEIIELRPDRWRVLLAREAKFGIDRYRTPPNDQLCREAITSAVGREIALEWVLTDRPMEKKSGSTAAGRSDTRPVETRPNVPQNQRIREAMANPLVKRFLDLFDGQVVRVDEPRPLAVAPPKGLGESTDTRSEMQVDDLEKRENLVEG